MNWSKPDLRLPASPVYSSFLPFLERNGNFFLFNVGVRVNLRVPRLIPRALKLTTI
jgi:hypothetical protein